MSKEQGFSPLFDSISQTEPSLFYDPLSYLHSLHSEGIIFESHGERKEPLVSIWRKIRVFIWVMNLLNVTT